ncbi:MAG TPA: YggT family protein [Clostridia bacterium]|nr:YggT family protein [Clostridia bacterium]
MESNETAKETAHEKNHKCRKIIYFILGVLESLLAFRLLFKLMGANPASGFVSFIYNLSNVFLVPFKGIFRPAVTEGIETRSVLEPSTLIAMAVYALVAYGIVRLIEIYRESKR